MSKYVLLLSDELADPFEKILQSTMRAFPLSGTLLKSRSFLTKEDLDDCLASSGEECLTYYHFTQPTLRERMKQHCEDAPCVDLFSLLSSPLSDFLQKPCSQEPSSVRLDSDYYARMEAIEFSVRYDDGKETHGIEHADIILIGISRTSKTPLSMYLAGMGYKCANIPLYPEVELPQALFEIDALKIIGLTHNIDELIRIRRERLKQMGLVDTNRYADLSRIALELQYALEIFARLGCMVIDVSGSAVEETAALIVRTMRQARIHDSETN